MGEFWKFKPFNPFEDYKTLRRNGVADDQSWIAARKKFQKRKITGFFVVLLLIAMGIHLEAYIRVTIIIVSTICLYFYLKKEERVSYNLYRYGEKIPIKILDISSYYNPFLLGYKRIKASFTVDGRTQIKEFCCEKKRFSSGEEISVIYTKNSTKLS